MEKTKKDEAIEATEKAAMDISIAWVEHGRATPASVEMARDLARGLAVGILEPDGSIKASVLLGTMAAMLVQGSVTS